MPMFDGHPHYTDRLRVAFEPLPGLPEPALAMRLEEEAMAQLQAILALEEVAPRTKDEEGEHAADFLRLERKLDLVLELLSMRLREDGGATEQDVWFSADGARWAWAGSQPPPVPGTIGIVSIYVHRVLPRPLRLPAQIMSDEPGWLRAGFLKMGDAVEDLLVRYVFLRHRRLLAGTRRSRRA